MAAGGVEPHLFVVFGGTGDLMRRKLLPAMYRLHTEGLLGERWHLLAVARKTEVTDDSFRAWAREALADSGQSPDDVDARWCSRCLHYQPLGQQTPQDYQALAARIAELEREHNLPGNRAFYLGLPPAAFPGAIESLGKAGLSRAAGWLRVVVEKPFGHDLTSAQELSQLVHRHFDESQTYRIDHYLGKETVQNLLVFRFANAIFESLWNREHVESVLITVAESIGAGERASYYDQVGALRDMVQNHLTQLLALTALEIPTAFAADAIRDEKAKVLHSLEPIRPDDVVFGQYASGIVNGQEVPPYREEPGVASDSETETFAALRLRIANWRWQGVPFYLRTGKRLPRRLTQIKVTFRATPLALFRTFDGCQVHSNVLVITLEPDEGFDLAFEVKAPGQPFQVQTHRLDFRYAEAFAPVPDAYETLLLDVLTGDQTLFVRADEIEAAWRVYTPLLEQRPPVHPYRAGTWGPEAANELLPHDALHDSPDES